MAHWRTSLAWWTLLLRHRWTYLMGLVGLALAVLTFTTQSVSAAVAAVLGLVIGVVGVAYDHRAWTRAQRLLICDSRESWEDWRLAGSLTRAGYEISQADPPVVYAPQVNRALRADADADRELLPQQRRKEPDSLHAAFLLLQDFNAKTVLFNGAKVSQIDDLQLSDGELQPVRLREGRYFDGLVTNEFGRKELMDTAGRVLYRGDDLFVEDRVVLPLAQSRASNEVGCSTLALTSDDVLVISRQGDKGRISPGKLTSSGSGSADWADAVRSTSLRDFVIRAVERELLEETGLSPATPRRTVVLGYARMLYRGGKPEYFCFTHLGAPYSEVRVRRQERGLMFNHAPLRVHDRDQFRESIARYVDDEGPRLSAELKAQLHVVTEALDEGWSPWGAVGS